MDLSVRKGDSFELPPAYGPDMYVHTYVSMYASVYVRMYAHKLLCVVWYLYSVNLKREEMLN